MATIAVDLGKRCSGLAVFDDDDRLVFADEVTAAPHAMAQTLARHAREVLATDDAVELAYERMRDYTGKGARAVALAGLRRLGTDLTRAMRRRFDTVVVSQYTADAWKGRVPKAISFRRILAMLTEAEHRAILVAGKESLDAVGIGLFHVGRARRGMIS